MLQSVYYGARVGSALMARLAPYIGRSLSLATTALGVKEMTDFLGALFTSTGVQWKPGALEEQFVRFVGNDPARMIPILDVAAESVGSERVLAILEGMDKDGLTKDDINVIDEVKKVLGLIVDRIDETTGDGEADEVWGVDEKDYDDHDTKQLKAFGYIRTLLGHFNSTDEIRAYREALLGVEEKHLESFEKYYGV